MKQDTIGSKVLAFLAGNLLDPTPFNYRFGYLYLNRTSKVIVEETDTYIDSGMRMTQEAVAEIMQKFAQASEDPAERIAARDEALDLFLDAAGELANSSNRSDRLQRDLEEARNKALVDELTGSANRRAARTTIQDLETRKVRYCIAIIDVDHFKSINDTYGHTVGDRALKLVATALEESLAPWPVARWGGEEFLVIAEIPDPARMVEKVQAAKDDLAFRKLRLRETDEPMNPITFSAGVAGCSSTSEQTLRRADNALYKAKQSGRNTVLIAPETGRVGDA